MNESPNVFLSLTQGKQFEQNQYKNNKKNINIDIIDIPDIPDTNIDNNQSTSIIEGFTATSDDVSSYKRKPVFLNEYNRIKANQKSSSTGFEELNNLQSQYNNLSSQYIDIQKTSNQEGLEYIDRISPNNPYLKTNIRVNNSDGQLPIISSGIGGYVTSKGIFKNYADQSVFNSTAGKNGCPIRVINDVKNDKFSATLRNGTDMKIGQSCGNEGQNVYVSDVLTPATTSSVYDGCYYNTNPNSTSDSAMTAATGLYTMDECKQYAIDSGNQYFALQGKPDDNYKSTCLVGNDQTTIRKYGNASKQIIPKQLWTTNGLKDINGATKVNGHTSVRLNNKGQLVFSNASNQEQTFKLGTNESGCEDRFSKTTLADSNGSDLKHLTNTNLNTCKDVTTKTAGAAGFGMNTNGRECYIKSNLNKLKRNNTRDTYTLVRAEPISKCKFFMILQSDGNFVIYKGPDPSKNEGGLWATMTNGQQLDSNPDWISGKGKFGKPYLLTGQNMAINEWIGSDDGKLQLMLDSTGNLVLYTSTVKQGCTYNRNSGYYGDNNSINAVYKLSEKGVPGNLGNVAYIDNNMSAHKYPANMLEYSNEYNMYSNFDTANNDSHISGNPMNNMNECKESCNSNNGCAGFVWVNNGQDANMCYLKNSNMFPKSPRVSNNNRTMGVRKPKINNGDKCNKSIVEIDSLKYENYIKGSDMTVNSALCKDVIISETTRIKLDEIHTKMNMKEDEISAKIKDLYARDKNIFDTMDVNDENLKKKILMYKSIAMGKNNQQSIKEGMRGLNMSDIDGMLADTDIRILQENYGYIFWSVLAVGLLTVTVNLIKTKQ